VPNLISIGQGAFSRLTPEKRPLPLEVYIVRTSVFIGLGVKALLRFDDVLSAAAETYFFLWFCRHIVATENALLLF
jgi:hypothetical protein